MASLPDVRAKYTLVRSDANGYTLEHRRVDYDRAAVMASVQASHNPAAEFILRTLRGENRPPWSKNISIADAERLGLPAEWAN
jgi:hypothetical protein